MQSLTERDLLEKVRADSVAQLVEQYTFNVWVLGSNPSRVTYEDKSFYEWFVLFSFRYLLSAKCMLQSEAIQRYFNNKSIQNEQYTTDINSNFCFYIGCIL